MKLDSVACVYNCSYGEIRRWGKRIPQKLLGQIAWHTWAEQQEMLSQMRSKVKTKSRGCPLIFTGTPTCMNTDILIHIDTHVHIHVHAHKISLDSDMTTDRLSLSTNSLKMMKIN